MRRATTAEMVVQFLVFNTGMGGITLVALYYPDSSGIFPIIALILTLGALAAVAFYFSRARKNQVEEAESKVRENAELTTIEMVVPYLVFVTGIGGMTLAALYYPDNDILQIIGLILTMGAVLAVAFYFSRARKKST